MSVVCGNASDLETQLSCSLTHTLSVGIVRMSVNKSRITTELQGMTIEQTDFTLKLHALKKTQEASAGGEKSGKAEKDAEIDAINAQLDSKWRERAILVMRW